MLSYGYDAGGNLKKDLNKGFGTIAQWETLYNHLNLPRHVKWGSSKQINYVYDATGVKLEKKVTDGVNTTTILYDGGYVYKDNVLQYFPHGEGYVSVMPPVIFSGSSTPYYRDFESIYQYKDHLGNVRLSYTKSITGNIEIVEEDNYYAFGMKHAGYNNVVTGLGNASAQKYKYNGKELQNELGLNMYDYGARNYDPAIGRWMNIDPLAETSRRWSPYTYCYNSPLKFVDPDGMQADWVKDGGEWAWRSDITSAEQATDAGYSDYSDGKTNNTYQSVQGGTVTLMEDRKWSNDRNGEIKTAPDTAPSIQEVNTGIDLSVKVGGFSLSFGLELAIGNASNGFNAAARVSGKFAWDGMKMFSTKAWSESKAEAKASLGAKLSNEPTLKSGQKTETSAYGKYDLEAFGTGFEGKVSRPINNPNVISVSVGVKTGIGPGVPKNIVKASGTGGSETKWTGSALATDKNDGGY